MGDREAYFIPHLFSTTLVEREALLPTATISVDLDDSDLAALNVNPTYSVMTSKQHRQGYWILDELADLDLVEVVSRNLAYSVPRADRTSWGLTTPFRLPDTLNHKYLEPYPVHEDGHSGRRYPISDLELLPDPPDTYTLEQLAFFEHPPDTCPYTGPHMLIEQALQQHKMPPKLKALYTVSQPPAQRTQYIWHMLLQCLGMGMNRDDAFWLAKLSPNNPYAGLQFHADRELAKDVLRAEAYTQTRTRDIRELISEARSGKGDKALEGKPHERKQQLFNIVFDHMQANGEFIHTGDYLSYYIRKDRGRPIYIARHSTLLSALLDIQYGLNYSEPEHSFVCHGLEAHMQTLPQSGTEQALSYYDRQSDSLYVHSGKRDMYQITRTTIRRLVNGAQGIVFPWGPKAEAFTPTQGYAEQLEGKPWHTALFKEAVQNVVNMSPKQAEALLTCWLLQVIFKDMAASRPILALFGAPGSGKSTLARRIYRLLFGRHRALSAITSWDDFDHATANEALVVFDNVDQTPSWLPDRLAQCISPTQIERRKLYSDNDIFLLERKAMVCVTAHKAEFSRADVADRLLILTLRRFEESQDLLFEAEMDMLDNISKRRNALWGGIFDSIQTILNTPKPDPHTVPQLRIQDFSVNGVWFAKALGIEQDFRDALHTITYSQSGFALENYGLLIEAMNRLLLHKVSTDYLRPTELFNRLSMVVDSDNFVKTYRNSAALGRTLVALQAPLRHIFDIDWKFDTVTAGRLWRIARSTHTGDDDD